MSGNPIARKIARYSRPSTSSELIGVRHSTTRSSPGAKVNDAGVSSASSRIRSPSPEISSDSSNKTLSDAAVLLATRNRLAGLAPAAPSKLISMRGFAAAAAAGAAIATSSTTGVSSVSCPRLLIKTICQFNARVEHTLVISGGRVYKFPVSGRAFCGSEAGFPARSATISQ